MFLQFEATVRRPSDGYSGTPAYLDAPECTSTDPDAGSPAYHHGMSDVVITVRGQHETTRTPERAVAHASVAADGRDRGEVVARVSALARAVQDDLAARQEAGAVLEWSSQRMAVWSDRPWNAEGKRLPLVHHASVDVTATFGDVSELSSWTNSVIEHDGVRLSHIQWQLTPDTRARVEQDVAAAAVSVAVARATAYARALGLGSVVPLEVADTGLLSAPDQPRPERMFARMAADTMGGGPEIRLEPEDIVVTASVEARFAAH